MVNCEFQVNLEYLLFHYDYKSHFKVLIGVSQPAFSLPLVEQLHIPSI